MKKILFFALLCITGCTYYTEKQSEALSQNVYATNDSVNKGRVDLAYYYSAETTKLVKIPKHRIPIQPVVRAGKVIKGASPDDSTRIIIVPAQYKGESVIVVGSTDYQELLKTRSVAEQLKKDNVNLANDKKDTDREVVRQKDMNNKMVIDLNHLQQEVYKKDLAILWRNIIIIGLFALIAGYIYLRMNRLFFF
jgi:hypothetical protein